jgi:hypothetical protein
VPPTVLPPPPAEPQGILWALVPLMTFGWGTPFSFAYAAIKRGSPGLGVMAMGYGAGSAASMLMISTGALSLNVLAMLLMLTLWVGGTAHAFAVRPTVYPRKPPRDQANEHAISVAKYRRVLREQARALAADDPSLAIELRIGRPDLPRAYNDGGLIDVNHAPPGTLALLPGMTEEIVERIVRVRGEQGTFFSVEELGVDADLSPNLVQSISEYTIFLP